MPNDGIAYRPHINNMILGRDIKSAIAIIVDVDGHLLHAIHS